MLLVVVFVVFVVVFVVVFMMMFVTAAVLMLFVPLVAATGVMMIVCHVFLRFLSVFGCKVTDSFLQPGCKMQK